MGCCNGLDKYGHFLSKFKPTFMVVHISTNHGFEQHSIFRV